MSKRVMDYSTPRLKRKFASALRVMWAIDKNMGAKYPLYSKSDRDNQSYAVTTMAAELSRRGVWMP